MVAVTKSHAGFNDYQALRSRAVRPLELIQGSLSSKKVARQSPLLAGLHRIADGALIGVVVAVAMMAALALHWQHRWTSAFNELEKTRILAHRLTDSTSVLERHFLERSRLPNSLVPTKVANLLYLDPPRSRSEKLEEKKSSYSRQIEGLPIYYGY